MIFVTVGNATDGFLRMLDAVECLAREGLFESEEVFVQRGNNLSFHPVYCRQEDFLTAEAFAARIHRADLIICHGGAGTLLHVLRAGKVPVVMPRRQRYGEVVDDHQMELIAALSAEGRVIPALEPEDLPEAIVKARQLNIHHHPLPSSPMLSLVAQALDELIGQAGTNHRQAA